MQPILRNHIYDVIEVEELEKRLPSRRSEYTVPEELQGRLDATPQLRAPFEALTPGRRKSQIESMVARRFH